MEDLAQKHKTLSHEVDKHLGEILDEFAKATKHLGNDRQFVRTRLLLAFSFLEVVCNVYNSYYNLSLTNRPLLLQWIKDYCLNEKNVVFKEHEDVKRLTDEHLYKFRNAIIHAFALPEPENDISIVVPNGDEKSAVLDKYKKGFKDAGQDVLFISPDSLMALFTAGAQILIKDIFAAGQDLQTSYDGFLRIQKETERRAALGVPVL